MDQISIPLSLDDWATVAGALNEVLEFFDERDLSNRIGVTKGEVKTLLRKLKPIIDEHRKTASK
jgi:hypothetical protein